MSEDKYMVRVVDGPKEFQKELNEVAGAGWELHSFQVVPSPNGREVHIVFVRVSNSNLMR